jgi:hypothetical protein
MKRAPVQGFSAGIPWDMHLRAYDVYCAEWGKQDAMIDLEGKNCRGGFSIRELDKWIPGWREELDERKALAARIEELEQVLRPFSDFAAGIHPSIPDDMPLTMGSRMARRQVTAGDFRRAALAQTGEKS